MMADQRMYLVHRPSGRAIGIGKRMFDRWSAAGSDVQRFFDLCDANWALEGDDFVLALETDAWNPAPGVYLLEGGRAAPGDEPGLVGCSVRQVPSEEPT